MSRYYGEEDRLHMAVAKYLRAQYPRIIAVHAANEGKRSIWEARKAKDMGLQPGVPDWLILSPHIGRTRAGLGLELKSAKGKLTENQAAYLSNLSEWHGWQVATARSFDEAKLLIDNFLTGH